MRFISTFFQYFCGLESRLANWLWKVVRAERCPKESRLDSFKCANCFLISYSFLFLKNEVGQPTSFLRVGSLVSLNPKGLRQENRQTTKDFMKGEKKIREKDRKQAGQGLQVFFPNF